MAKRENLGEGLRKSEWKEGTGAGGTTPPEVKVSFLQSFLARLKLFGLIKQENPDFKLTEVELRELDEKLESPNKQEQEGAMARIEELLKVRDGAAEKAESTKMKEVVTHSNLTGAQKIDLEAKADFVDTLLTPTTTTRSQADLERAYVYLQEMRDGLGSENLGVFVERPEGFAYVEEQLAKLSERKKLAEFKTTKQGEFRTSPIGDYENEFSDVKHPNDLLQIRSGDRAALEPELEAFRKNVREELLEPGGKARLDHESTSGDLVLKRVQEVSEWRARMHELYGDKWVGSKRQDEIRDLLLKVEAEYQDALVRKVQANFIKRGSGQDLHDYVESATAQVLEGYRKRGTSHYEFKPTDNFVKIAGEIRSSAEVIRHRVGEAAGGRVAGPQMSPEMMEMYAGGMEQSDKQQRFNRQKAALDKILTGTQYELDDTFFADLAQENGLQTVLDNMRAAGIDVEYELGQNFKVKHLVENVRNSYMSNEDGFGDLEKDLRTLITDDDYAEGINRVMEFISRVGLKEASSDWKLTILFRQMKDMVSRVNPDLAEGFEARQHLRYLPSINSIMPEKFGEIASQVMAKPNVDLSLSPENAYMMGAQITVGEKKLNVSTAAFKDLLRSESNSMKLLDADINTTDSTLEGIFVEHVWGKGAKIIDHGTKLQIPGVPDAIDIDSLDNGVMMDFFDIDVKSAGFKELKIKPDRKPITIRQMLNRTQWMRQDAQQFWWYGREWEKYLANYPKEQMESAPKGLAAAGRMWGAYKTEFEQVSRTMNDVAMLGAMLQPNEVYKMNDAIGTNVRETMLKHIMERAETRRRWESDPAYRQEQLKLADDAGKLFTLALGNRVVMSADSEKYVFLLDSISREDLRLIGNDIDVDNFAEVWEVAHQRFLDLGMKEIDIPDIRLAEQLSKAWDRAKDKTKITDEQTRFWGLQVAEMRALIQSKKFEALQEIAELDETNFKGFNIKKVLAEFQDPHHPENWEALRPLFENQERVHGDMGKITATNMAELFKQLEFSTVLSWAKTSQGDDPFQYGAKYYQKAVEAGNLLTKILNMLNPTSEDIMKLHDTMMGYVPAPELRKFEIILNHRIIQSRTNQIIPYEVVAQKKNAESPNAFDFVTLTDSEKRKWQVKGRNGERGVVKTKYIGNFGWREKGQWGYRDSDIEMRTKYLNAVGFLTKKKADEMYEQAVGINGEVTFLAGLIGLNSKPVKAIDRWVADRLHLEKTLLWHGGHFVSFWGTKAKTILKKHPLFDDPVWAFWSILNEFVELGAEAQKEIVKEISH